VGNLSLEITEDDLRREFVNFGHVTSVILMNDRGIGSGQGRVCGYIEMPSAREGESAIERLQGILLRGRKLDIIKALPVTHYFDDKIDNDPRVRGFNRKTRYWGIR